MTHIKMAERSRGRLHDTGPPPVASNRFTRSVFRPRRLLLALVPLGATPEAGQPEAPLAGAAYDFNRSKEIRSPGDPAH